MALYDNKLGDWFKQVEKREKEFKQKKTAPGTQQSFEEFSSTSEPRPIIVEPDVQGLISEINPVQSAPVVQRAEESVVAILDVEESEQQTQSQVGEAKPASGSAQPLFDDSELSPVEDFFTFLERGEAKPAENRVAAETIPEVTEVEVNLERLSEGTGSPRPISSSSYSAPRVESVSVQPASVAQVPLQPAIREPEADIQEKWDRLPHHLQTLFANPDEEVAQNSYKTFKETRNNLIHRLLDPQLTLEESARILNVCPTTVRRYTNKGVLKCYRTAGNQRRFRLSDVLYFMENGSRRVKSSDNGASAEI